MHKELATVIIEKALLGISMPVYESIVTALKSEYNCTISDCYEHPEYLKKVLAEYFGNASNVVVDQINKDLRKTTHNDTISEFLTVLNR